MSCFYIGESKMGRFVVQHSGNIDWEWKFRFARQCSNFGVMLEEVASHSDEVYVDRYTGDDGEFVMLKADKNKLVEALSSIKLESCPICKTSECLEATLEMLKNFKEAVKEVDEPEIYGTWFVEYL